MDPLAFLSKLFRRRKLELTPKDIALRAPRLDEYEEWSKNKRLLIFNPPFWGFHDIFIDDELNHALICIKETREAFVISGNTKGGERVLKYGPNLDLESEEDLDPGLLEWIVYDDFVVYRGPFLPIGRDPYYIGKVAATFPFNKKIEPSIYPGLISYLTEWYIKNRS